MTSSERTEMKHQKKILIRYIFTFIKRLLFVEGFICLAICLTSLSTGSDDQIWLRCGNSSQRICGANGACWRRQVMYVQVSYVVESQKASAKKY